VFCLSRDNFCKAKGTGYVTDMQVCDKIKKCEMKSKFSSDLLLSLRNLSVTLKWPRQEEGNMWNNHFCCIQCPQFNQSSIKKTFNNSIPFIKNVNACQKNKVEQIWRMTFNCICDTNWVPYAITLLLVKAGKTILKNKVAALLIKPLHTDVRNQTSQLREL